VCNPLGPTTTAIGLGCGDGGATPEGGFPDVDAALALPGTGE
jgi:hypothetical protein